MWEGCGDKGSHQMQQEPPAAKLAATARKERRWQRVRSSDMLASSSVCWRLGQVHARQGAVRFHVLGFPQP